MTRVSIHDFNKKAEADAFAQALHRPDCGQTTVQKTKRLKPGEELRGGRYVVEVWRERTE